MKNKKSLFLSALGLISLVACSNGTSSNSSYKSDTSTDTNTSENITTSEDVLSSSTTSEKDTSESHTSNNNETSNSQSSSNYETPVVGNLKITKKGSSYETIYIEWESVQNATSYNVYFKELDSSNYQKLDDMLIRKYSSHFRADIVGLKAGNYSVKVIACNNNGETDTYSTFDIGVLAHIREGFGFKDGDASGAYNNDGTLKSNAVVVYVTSKNAKTVSATIDGTKYTGLQDILSAKQKADCKTPLNIRVIGTINVSDVDYFGSSSEGLQLKGKSAFSELNTTIEGIGNDATFKGFGILMRNCKNVELRNIGFMDFMDDGISIDTDNCNLWIHNNDFFYGKQGSGDKAKGDGALDTKGSKNITHSFNHFWDSGKCNLQGMNEETEENRITYHHNWFDHSDSRHPRVRTGTIHVYNNYYDGNAKYGIGATMGASIFSEANYFRSCKYPMLISLQGSDIATDSNGTFSGEDGGMIKSFNDFIIGQKKFVSYQTNNVEFDAYVASSRDEKLSTNVKAKVGGTIYNNFDTDSTMYKYNIETPDQAKNTVTTYAGRTEGGDFKWTFSTSEDSNYDIIPELRNAITNYKTSLVSIQGDSSSSNGSDSGSGDSSSSDSGNTSGDSNQEITDDIYHNFSEQGFSSTVFEISGNPQSKPNTVSYNGLTLTAALKMESQTSITFKTTIKMEITLVFDTAFTGSVKIDGTKYNATNGIVQKEIEAGTHVITKGDTANLYYIGLRAV